MIPVRLAPGTGGWNHPLPGCVSNNTTGQHNREHRESTGGTVAAQRKGKRIWIWGGLLAVVVVAVLTLTAMHRGGKHFDPSRLDKVTRGEIDQSVVATGKVQPITKIELKSKASGIVQNLYVDINQHTHKGQLLAQLDRQEITAEVEAQRATLQAAEANVKSAMASIEHDKVDASAPDLPMYYATLQRNQEMIKEGIVSQQGMDNANRDYLSALNKKNVAVAQIDVDRAKLHQAEAQVAQNQASLKSLEEQLSYTTLTSPIDGEVLSRDVEVGDAVSSILVLGSTATLVMTIGDTRQVYVNGKVDEADIASVYLGQLARIRIESFKNKTFTGKVTRIAPLGVEKDNVTTFEVRVSIDNPNHEIKANMTANAEILNQEHKDALSVPEQALIYDNQKNAFVDVPDSKAGTGLRRVAVRAGIANGSRTEILSGLSEGQTVYLQP
jgi:HlyD family secretion protein